MPKPDKYIKADDAARNLGLVYMDEGLSAGPATHVLVVGVAAYKKLTVALKTATLSAREVADWFVDGQKARFANPGCGLGSVAVVLSEMPGDAKSQYAGGDVPRATFVSVSGAISSWVDRINTHKDNLAILYIASHGESFLNRTAFLLEDFGTVPNKAIFGMADVERLMASLENAKPLRQLLLFDVCRTPTPLRLPPGETFESLISLTADTDSIESPRQWVICSTSLGDPAGGFKNAPTLFSSALLDALNGVASDGSSAGWPVRPGLLVDKIDRILKLYQLPGEQAQTPAGHMAGSFDITFPGKPKDVPVYISLSDPGDWPHSTISIKVNSNPSAPIDCSKYSSPFHVRLISLPATLDAEVMRNGVAVGSALLDVEAPAQFLEIGGFYTPTDIGPVPAGRGPGDTQLLIKVIDPDYAGNVAIADIVRRDQPETASRIVINPTENNEQENLSPGTYSVTLRTPNGLTQTRDVVVQPDRISQVEFNTVITHEWLRFATIAGAIRTSSDDGTSETVRVQKAAELVFSGALAGEVGFDLEIKKPHAASMALELGGGPPDARFLRFNVNDQISERFRAEDSAMPRPLFARITCSDGRSELAVVPSLGGYGRYTIGGWTPFVMIDRFASDRAIMSSVVVEDSKWSSLLGYVAARDFASGTKLLESPMGQDAIAAMLDKTKNPLAAVAGALIAVAASRPDIDKSWDPWLENIANWFVNIPDGPIILGRRRLMRAQSKEQLVQARIFFTQGFNRGVPFFSLSLDWLARGLDSLPGNDDELVRMRTLARQVSNRVDPTLAFTVVRMSN